MDITIQHERNPLVGWNLAVKVTADSSEVIVNVTTEVNGFSSSSDDLSPPVKIFTRTLEQQGTYPGDNEVRVTARDSKDNEVSAVDRWSSP